MRALLLVTIALNAACLDGEPVMISPHRIVPPSFNGLGPAADKRIRRQQWARFGFAGDGVSTFNMSVEQLELSKPVSGISIAADSEIDTVDIFPAGRDEPSGRLRVSVSSPHVGWLPAGNYIVRALSPFFPPPTLQQADNRFLAIEPGSNSVGTLVADPAYASSPLLSLDLHDESSPPPTWMLRAPRRWNGRMTDEAQHDFLVSSMGRRRVSIVIARGSIDGGGTATFTIRGRTQALDQTFTLELDAGALALGVTSFEYNGAPFDFIEVALTATDLMDANVIIDLYDE